jgi:outer membrane receptor protein involved in Fe transport
MNWKAAQLRAHRAAHLAALFGTASLATLAAGSSAYAAAAAAAAAPVEEVLITGSLISGAPAIGLPVTTLGEETFQETGALNITEMLETVPGIDIPPVVGPVEGGGTLHFASSVNIHNVGEGDTLMMLDGLRWPLAGYDGLRVDPSIFPQIAVQRTDVLTAGASATYGADAAAGVINVILRRGYDGAQTNARFGFAQGAAHENYMFSQLFGRQWDNGGVTIAYEIQRENHVPGDALPWNTLNFSESGFEGLDFTTISASSPGVVSTGPTRTATGAGNNPVPSTAIPSGMSRDRFGGIYCSNCWSVPAGVGWNFGDRDPGPTTSWAAILARPGVADDIKINPWHDGWALPEMDSNAATITFDQEIARNVDLFGIPLGTISLQADGFYSNKRYKQVYPTDQGQAVESLSPVGLGYTVPTNNPYRPTGVPAGTDLRVHFDLGPELDSPQVSGGQINSRWLVGLNFDDLPLDWNGKIRYAQTDNYNYGFDRGGVISNSNSRYNMALAALGNTVAAAPDFRGPDFPSLGAFTKPTNVPYLNPFCDNRIYKCNSPLTLAYITGFRDQSLRNHATEINAQIDGPLPWELPGGPILVALAYDKATIAQNFVQTDNTNSQYAGQVVITGDDLYDVNNAFIGQMNIPILGDAFTLPFAQRLDLELGIRRDTYDTLEDSVWTPKVAGNWVVGFGLTVSASWGKSFRTPKGEQISRSGASVSANNLLGGVENLNSIRLICDNTSLGVPGGTALPGSLTSILNPTCAGRGPGFPPDPTGALSAPAILSVGGPPVLTGPILEASGLATGLSTSVGPQKATQYNVGFNFAPSEDDFGGWLSGFNLTGTYWNLRYRDLIGATGRGTGPDDPLSREQFIVIPNPAAPITDASNAAFFQLVRDLSAVSTRQNRSPDPEHMLNMKAIRVNLTGNLGIRELSGVDFTFRYDYDVGNWGTFNIGAQGSYIITDRSKNNVLDPNWSVNYGKHGPTDQVSITTGNQLQKVRYRLGWTNGTWSSTVFLNYTGHSAQDPNGAALIPPCYYAVGSGPGSCFPGSPYYGPFTSGNYPTFTPANIYTDLNISYNTRDSFTNTYLQNIVVSMTIVNVTGKTPPLGVHPLRSRGTGVVAYDRNYSPFEREFTFTVSKLW